MFNGMPSVQRGFLVIFLNSLFFSFFLSLSTKMAFGPTTAVRAYGQ